MNLEGVGFRAKRDLLLIRVNSGPKVMRVFKVDGVDFGI